MYQANPLLEVSVQGKWEGRASAFIAHTVKSSLILPDPQQSLCRGPE